MESKPAGQCVAEVADSPLARRGIEITREATDRHFNAIKTEGEAADYVRQVTEAIHAAHQAAAAKRARLSAKRTSKGKAKKKSTPKARQET
jgi:hypothetical protein